MPGCPGGSPYRGGSRCFYFLVYPWFFVVYLTPDSTYLMASILLDVRMIFSAATFSFSQLSSLKRSSYGISIFSGFFVHSVSTCFWSSSWLPHSLHVRSSLNVAFRALTVIYHVRSWKMRKKNRQKFFWRL